MFLTRDALTAQHLEDDLVDPLPRRVTHLHAGREIARRGISRTAEESEACQLHVS